MVIQMNKETKHIKDQNVDTQGYSEYEIFQRANPWLVTLHFLAT